MSSNSVHGEVYTIQHYVIKFVSGFVWVFRFPPPILKWLTSLDVVFYTEVFVNIFHLNQMVICMLLRVCFFQILFFLNDEIFMKMLLIVLKYFFISWLSSKEYYVENLTKFIIIFFIIFFYYVGSSIWREDEMGQNWDVILVTGRTKTKCH